MVEAYTNANVAGKPAAVAEVEAMVARIITDYRGLETYRALAAASEALCMGQRRVRGLFHGEAMAVSDDELADARVAYAGYLRQRRDRLRDEVTELTVEIRRMGL